MRTTSRWMGLFLLLITATIVSQTPSESPWREAAARALGVPAESIVIEHVARDATQPWPSTSLKVRFLATGRRCLVALDAAGNRLPDDRPSSRPPPGARAGAWIHPVLAGRLAAAPEALEPIGIWLVGDPAKVDFREHIDRLVATGLPVPEARRQLRRLVEAGNAPVIAAGRDLLDTLSLPVTYADPLAPVLFSVADADGVRRLAESPLVHAVYALLEYRPQLVNQVATHRWNRVHSFGVVGAGVKVAVVEGTAVAPGHPDLNVTAWYQLPTNIHNHPTAIAGMIGSSNLQYPGHARGVEIISGNSGSDSWSTHQLAASWALSQGADILNLSIGGDSGRVMELGDRYLDYQARYTATSMFVAAGNSGLATGNVNSPGLGWNYLTVGNFDELNDADWTNDVMFAESSWVNPLSAHGDREKPDLAANGSFVTSTNIAGGFSAFGSGTSYATPAIAGMAACLMQMDPALKIHPESVRAIMMTAATHNLEGATRLSDRDGAGGINGLAAYRIVDKLQYKYGTFTPSSFSTSGAYAHSVWLDAGDRTRVTLCWDSRVLNAVPATPYSPDTLEVDLDLSVYQGTGVTGTPLAISASFDNAFEIVEFVPPVTGFYTFRIDDFLFNEPSMPYGFAWSQDRDGRHVRLAEDLPATTANDLVGPCIGNPSVGLNLFDPVNAGKALLIAASLGFTSGLPLPDGRLIDIDVDWLTTLSVSAGQPFFLGALGAYDAQGRYAGYHLSLPDDPALAGFSFLLSALTLDGTAPSGIREIATPHQVSIAGHATTLALSDDGSQLVPIGFAFPFQGQNYSFCFVNANGNVTFGAPSAEYVESAAALIGGPPRIAVFWDDLNPAAGGVVRVRNAFQKFIVEWVGVPEYGAANSNNAILELRADGTIDIRYLTCGLQDCLVGISPGSAASTTLDPWDLSHGYHWGPTATPTIYELFDGTASTFDLGVVVNPFNPGVIERNTVTFRVANSTPIYCVSVDL